MKLLEECSLFKHPSKMRSEEGCAGIHLVVKWLGTINNLMVLGSLKVSVLFPEKKHKCT